MKKLIIVIILLMTQAVSAETLLANPNDSSLKSMSKHQVNAPRTKHRLMFTLNAERGNLIHLSDSSYHLVLRKVSSQVSVTLAKDATTFNSLYINKFVQGWKKSMLRQNRNYTVDADLTGVQANEKNMESSPFDLNVRLGKIFYDKRHTELSFTVQINQNEKARLKTLENFDNVTLYVNGCDLCSCTSSTVSCFKIFKMVKAG